MSRGDRWLLVLPLVLTAVGLIMVYSSSAILGITVYKDPDHFLINQLVRIGLGIIAFLVASRLADLRLLERHAPKILATTVALLLVVIVVGHSAGGAVRWIKVGAMQLQPTDVARLAAVVFLAWWLKRRPPAELGFARGLLPPLAIVCGLSGLILLQPNLSSAGLLGVCGFALIFLAEAPWLHLAAPVAVGCVAVVVAVRTHPYMMERVDTYARFLFTGALDARGSGWQLDQSLIAIGSGGWWGRGLGGGLQKYLYLPEAHTDFIYSILAEELGFLGSTVLIALFVALAWRGLRVTARANDPFHFLLAAGLTLQIGLYAIVNLAVATGLVPTTGLPLPFVSYGGSALLANLAAAGLLYRISVVNETGAAVDRLRWGNA